MAQHEGSLQQVLRRSLTSVVNKGFRNDLWLKKMTIWCVSRARFDEVGRS